MSNTPDLCLNTGDQVDSEVESEVESEVDSEWDSEVDSEVVSQVDSQVDSHPQGNTGNSITSKSIPNVPPTPVEANMTSGQLIPGTFYEIKTNNRGLFVIINNRDFTNLKPRPGTDVDCSQMKKLFTELEFQVEVYTNATIQKMRAVFEAVSAMDHNPYSAFGCCILSHGRYGAVWGTDDIIYIKELTGMLKDTKFNGKPKLFFIQACQGKDQMELVTANAPRAGDMMDDEDDDQENLKVPSEADFLYAYSTAPGYVSKRNRRYGSWFIQAVTKVFRANAHKMDIGHMLTRVNLEVSKHDPVTNKKKPDQKTTQISSIVSQLRYDLYLFPPNGPLTPAVYPEKLKKIKDPKSQ